MIGIGVSHRTDSGVMFSVALALIMLTETGAFFTLMSCIN